MKTDYRVTDRHERKTLRAVMEIEYETNEHCHFPPELRDLQVLEMTINPDYKGVGGLRVVSINLIEPRPRGRKRE